MSFKLLPIKATGEPNMSDRTHVGILRNADGTYARLFQFPCAPATPEPHVHSQVLSKDIPINPSNQTWLRIYLPLEALDSSSITKLPLIVYYHGGGFVFMSAASTVTHSFCNELAAQTVAIVVSVEYRLAPEHRLPAAYDDAVEALHYIKATQDEWLTEYADFSNCFLMGTSAGGNIAYHAGLRVAAAVNDDGLKPLKIQGLILHHPFFGGLERTGSELRLADASVLTLAGCDDLWELSLPVDADRDHVFCNPTVCDESGLFGRVRSLGWRVLVTGGFEDMLIDRQMEFAKMLEKKGICTVGHFGEGYHGMEVSEPSKAKELFFAIQKPKHPGNIRSHLAFHCLHQRHPINQSNNTWLRIFLPRETHDSPSAAKLPLVVYYHGGGFVLYSAASFMFHDFCTIAAVQIPAVIVSVEYRLAPEHRLPAAYDDCLDALHWINSSNEEWLTKYADFSSCFLMGTSAGGNIAYHVSLRAAACVEDLTQLKIRGLILHHPYFGGSSRTQSETRLADNKTLPLSKNDLMWELALPVGVDRDHEYCNPMVSGGPSGIWDEIKVLGWSVLVIGCDGDPLIDRQVELVKVLEEKGVNVVGKFGEGDYHAVEVFEPAKAGPLCVVVKEFISA
ncbi:hypothetical protein RJ640_022925 [Escallonia rubra]|uniref:Alpha/beta hydrolase fold-3 domain-containing protein n=1 Tax=Escallonia rubra TaxID=112253 RepID=A0AA88S1D0_9ASTE|nr:hypothetical protein RJ640_022925 [Escallonia rubra]